MREIQGIVRVITHEPQVIDLDEIFEHAHPKTSLVAIEERAEMKPIWMATNVTAIELDDVGNPVITLELPDGQIVRALYELADNDESTITWMDEETNEQPDDTPFTFNDQTFMLLDYDPIVNVLGDTIWGTGEHADYYIDKDANLVFIGQNQ